MQQTRGSGGSPHRRCVSVPRSSAFLHRALVTLPPPPPPSLPPPPSPAVALSSLAVCAADQLVLIRAVLGREQGEAGEGQAAPSPLWLPPSGAAPGWGLLNEGSHLPRTPFWDASGERGCEEGVVARDGGNRVVLSGLRAAPKCEFCPHAVPFGCNPTWGWIPSL